MEIFNVDFCVKATTEHPPEFSHTDYRFSKKFPRPEDECDDERKYLRYNCRIVSHSYTFPLNSVIRKVNFYGEQRDINTYICVHLNSWSTI